MKKFTFQWEETEIRTYEIDIEAETKEEAEEKLIEQRLENTSDFYTDAENVDVVGDGEGMTDVRVIEIKEIKK